MSRKVGLVLAAGQGTRMLSEKPKVIHEICGVPMICYPVSRLLQCGLDEVLVVVGYRAQEVMESLKEYDVEFVEQTEQLGTAHAVMCAEAQLQGSDWVLVLSGDVPLISQQTLDLVTKLMDASSAAHDQSGAAERSFPKSVSGDDHFDCLVITAEVDEPNQYGRILRRSDGSFDRIIEDAEATEEERKIREVNSGIYCFRTSLLFDVLPHVRNDNRKGEYYLTDAVNLIARDGGRVRTVKILDSREVMGINCRQDIVTAEREMTRRTAQRLMKSGVTVRSPDSVVLSDWVEVGSDTEILYGTHVLGKCKIGKGCQIGPNCWIMDSEIGDGSRVWHSVVDRALIAENCNVGPFSNLRPGTVLKPCSKVGAFCEVKNSVVGEGSKVPHLSYIGDAEIGERVNIGAGTITCNFDGVKKHKTVIEDEAFIGSDTMLVAPVKVGRKSVTGAGSVITRDVPEDSLAIERTEQKIVPDWSERKKKKGEAGVGNKDRRADEEKADSV